MARILTLSIGSTSTKLAVFQDTTPVMSATVRHQAHELSCFKKITHQLDMRHSSVMEALAEHGVDLSDLDAVSAGGGPIKPMPGGVYRINEKLVEDIMSGDVYLQHPSHLGPLVAWEISTVTNIPGFMVDPVTTDEFLPAAKISGFVQIPRRSQAHALNCKAVTRRLSKELKTPYTDMRTVVAHIGGGTTVCALRNGQIIDAATSRQDGPFSAEAAGALPMPEAVDFILSSGKTAHELKSLWLGKGGLVSHLGTNSIQDVESMMAQGDEGAGLILEAMAHSVSKAIGAMAAVLGTTPDAIILTGGGAFSTNLVRWIRERVEFLSPVYVVPGEDEPLALAEAAVEALKGEEFVREYR